MDLLPALPALLTLVAVQRLSPERQWLPVQQWSQGRQLWWEPRSSSVPQLLSVPVSLSVLASSVALSSQEGASEPNHKWSFPVCTALFRRCRRREPVKTQPELRRHRRRMQ